MTQQPVILDVDTGVDDALAILCALRSPALDLQAISCVAGNVGIDQVVRNTLTVLAVAGSLDVPVGRGAAGPAPGRLAERTGHGRDGLADLGLPLPPQAAPAGCALDVLRRAIHAAPQPPTVVACGPLTNLAELFRTAPGLLGRLHRLVVVGGSAAGGIGGPDDFNVAYDLPAAEAVLSSRVATTMYPLDVFRRVVVSAREAEALAASEDPGTRLAGRLARHQARRFGAAGARIGDAGAVLSVVRPEALVTRPDPRWPRVGVAVDMEDRAAAVYRRLFLDTLQGG